MPHKINVQTMIRPTTCAVPINDILGNKPIAYSEVLKKLWKFWKDNQLNYTEKVEHPKV
jgi:hypothetical protein